MVGETLVKKAKEEILKPKHGRKYSGRPYTSSAPGEYSAHQTGVLLNSIKYRMSGANYLTFYSDAPHAGFQEVGTSKMEPRRNLIRAIEESDGLIAISWNRWCGAPSRAVARGIARSLGLVPLSKLTVGHGEPNAELDESDDGGNEGPYNRATASRGPVGGDKTCALQGPQEIGRVRSRLFSTFGPVRRH